MKAFRAGFFLIMAVFLGTIFKAGAQDRAFTYQGRLDAAGAPANGEYEMTFALFDAATNGNVVALVQTTNPVIVTNGLFTAVLEVSPAAFDGSPRWLEITVTVFGSDQPPVTLRPRQPITAAPYALHAAAAAGLMSAGAMDITVNGRPALRIEPGGFAAANIIGGHWSNSIAPGLAGAFIGGGGLFAGSDDRMPNRITASYGAIVGGYGHHVDEESGFIGGGEGNRVAAGADIAAIVGGRGNRIDPGAYGSFIGGGQYNGVERNSYLSMVGGGYQNTVQSNSPSATIAGGWWNFLGPNAATATISGGRENSVTGDAGTIGGGWGNTAAAYATVSGGRQNAANGFCSFAAGQAARAVHDGAFVWADVSPTFGIPFPFTSTSTNEFAVRATGGVRFVTAIEFDGAAAAGVVLDPGSGSWSSLSDRNAKENIAGVNTRDILEKVASLSLATWNYKSQDKSVRHIGPMAQDFRAAFGLGENDRTITTVDADGVALAAIQGLNQKLESENAALRSALHARDAKLDELQKRLGEIEGMLKQIAATRDASR